MDFEQFINLALEEDIREGDHSTLACIPEDASDKAVLKIKEDGVLAGVEVAQRIFKHVEPSCSFEILKVDGDRVKKGDQGFIVEAKTRTLLSTERLVLNIMQRMSGIASMAAMYSDKISAYNTKVLDTRKTTPNFRWFEKEAVRIGGGYNHRMGLYDMVMLKDNHIDFCGGIEKALDKTEAYLKEKGLDIKVEIETRNIDDVKRVLAHGKADRLMLDNFSPAEITEALELIDGKIETEASGGIEIDTIESYAKTGVDYISVGAIIHHATSMDISLKALR